MEWEGQTIWQAMNVKDLADGLDLHPMIVGLIFELPFTIESGKPQWTRKRRYQWEQTVKATLDLIYETTNVSVEAAARQDALRESMEKALREKIEAEHEQHVAALEAEVGSSKADAEELKRRLDRALGDLAQAQKAAQTRRLPDADPPVASGAKGGSVNQVAKRIVDQATRERQPISAEGEALMRTAAAVAGEPEAADEAIRRGSVSVSVKHGELSEDDAEVRCRVDGCDHMATSVGRWKGICAAHRAILVGNDKSTVLIDGVEHVLVRAPGGGAIRPIGQVPA